MENPLMERAPAWRHPPARRHNPAAHQPMPAGPACRLPRLTGQAHPGNVPRSRPGRLVRRIRRPACS